MNEQWYIKLSFKTNETIIQFVSKYLSFILKSIKQYSFYTRFSFAQETTNTYHIYLTLTEKEYFCHVTQAIRQAIISKYSISFVSDTSIEINPHFKPLPQNIYEIISLDVFKLCTTNPNITENALISYFFYFYILSCKSFFKTKKEAYKFNKHLFEKTVSELITGNEILNKCEFERVKEKIILEYDCMCIGQSSALRNNYAQLVKRWCASKDAKDTKAAKVTEHIEASTNPFAATIAQIIISQPNIEQYFANSFRIFGISPYYRPFVPYTINAIINDEI
jgi:hypothetical protein